mgnify:CR=1 FL=1
MKNTTLIYMEKDNKYLMMLRGRKADDPNSGKWIGVGGHIEEGETPDECIRREVTEETGLILLDQKLRGIIYFISDIYETEYMYLYTSDSFEGELNTGCDEGELEWIDISEVGNLPLWEGDRKFLKLLREDAPFFVMGLRYSGDALVSDSFRFP